MANWSSTKWNTTTVQYFSPPGCITDSPTGNYSTYANSAVTLINGLNLQNSPVAVINYWAKWRTEQGYDYVQFNLSGNSGPWAAQKGRYTKTGFYLEAAGQPLYDGSQPGWVKEQVVTTDFSNRTLKMQFVLKSDGGLNYDGFYFDDITVTVVDMTKVGTGELHGGGIQISEPVPNPASGKVMIGFMISEDAGPAIDLSGASLMLIDSRGIVIRKFPLNPDQKSISVDVNDLPPGIYFYRIIGTFGMTGVKKLVIVHSSM
jgi:hypothetical protein